MAIIAVENGSTKFNMRFTAKFPGGEWVKMHLQENKISTLPKLNLLHSTVSCEGECSSFSQFCINNVRNEKNARITFCIFHSLAR